MVPEPLPEVARPVVLLGFAWKKRRHKNHNLFETVTNYEWWEQFFAITYSANLQYLWHSINSTNKHTLCSILKLVEGLQQISITLIHYFILLIIYKVPFALFHSLLLLVMTPTSINTYCLTSPKIIATNFNKKILCC